MRANVSNKLIISSLEVQTPIGPYSQAVKIKGNSSLIFVSGQLPIDAQTGKLIVGGIEQMTVKIIENIRAILQAGGSDLSLVIRTEVFLTDLNNFSLVNGVYAKYFAGDNLPARQSVEVSRLPMDSPIEISCIAIAEDS